MKPLKVIGLNSGTSMDAIDAAVFLIEPKPVSETANARPSLSIKMLSSLLYPIDESFRDRLKDLVTSAKSPLEDLCRLNVALGKIFAQAALELIDCSGLKKTDIDLIGSHGQTIWHCPQKANFWGVTTTGTMQLGEAAMIAAATGIPVVADFRIQDMAFGGQGAPLVAFADEVLFAHRNKPTGILNLGGIANITIINRFGEAILAFDTGPGNMIIDRTAKVLYNLEFDPEGSLAAEGTINQEWLSCLLTHPYFKTKPPKTTGREMFGFSFADQLINQGKERNLEASDLIATITALTALSIAQAYEQFVFQLEPIDTLVLGGGGAENKTLVYLLDKFWPHPIEIKRHEEYGISTKFKEALLFALLAYTTYFGVPNNIPTCTGASRRVCLGKLSRP